MQLFDHSHDKESFFSSLNRNFHDLCPASSPFTGYHCEEPGSTFFTLSHQVFMHIGKILLSLLFSSLNISSSSSQMLHTLHYLYGPLLDSFLHAPISFVMGSPE